MKEMVKGMNNWKDLMFMDLKIHVVNMFIEPKAMCRCHGRRAPASSYKMNQFQGSNIQYGDHSYNTVTIYLKVAKRVEIC